MCPKESKIWEFHHLSRCVD
ncbi:hypothetical protein LINPERHAP1_LOCUS13696 [Linum perenne]